MPLSKIPTETSRALYRKLSLRSRLGFGKYAFGVMAKEDEPTIQEILGYKDGRDYLLWIYYNRSNIDFLPEVMSQLNPPQIISKPGTAPEVFEIIVKENAEVEKRRRASLSPEERMHEDELARKRELSRIRAQRFYEALEPTKKHYQAVNQGHKPLPNPKSIYSKNDVKM